MRRNEKKKYDEMTDGQFIYSKDNQRKKNYFENIIIFTITFWEHCPNISNDNQDNNASDDEEENNQIDKSKSPLVIQ